MIMQEKIKYEKNLQRKYETWVKYSMKLATCQLNLYELFNQLTSYKGCRIIST